MCLASLRVASLTIVPHRGLGLAPHLLELSAGLGAQGRVSRLPLHPVYCKPCVKESKLIQGVSWELGTASLGSGGLTPQLQELSRAQVQGWHFAVSARAVTPGSLSRAACSAFPEGPLTPRAGSLPVTTVQIAFSIFVSLLLLWPLLKLNITFRR